VPPPPPPYRPAPPDAAPRVWPGRLLTLALTGGLVAVAVAVRSNLVFGLVVVAAIFIPLERLLALHRDQRVLRTGWKTDLVHFVVNNLLTTAGLFVVIVAFVVALRAVVGDVPSGLQAAVRSQPFWLQFVEAIAVTDLAGYLAHRATHQVPWLWRFHAVHHSIAEMDWLAAARLHPVDQIFTRACVILPLFVLGFSRATFGAFLVAFTLWAIFIHANVRVTFGPLRWLIATPEYHHWHHTNDAGATNHNFAGMLPLIDVLFRTHHLSSGATRWPRTYGTDEPMPSTYLGQLTAPFRRR
jgi:sterol desaturase/sphingolipid hydroxylase (fatty acid hydroxylase superfamily)